MAQDYDKDLYIVLTGSGKTTLKNFTDNVEDYIFGDKDEREAEILMPYTKDLSSSLSNILTDWADGNYPIHAYVESEGGHRSISGAVNTVSCDDNGTVMTSGALEAAMGDLVARQKAGDEVVVVVVYDEETDVKLVGELKNYQSIPVLNLDGMIDSFPGFKTTDEILEEERKREEFETKEAIRIAAEKEQEKANKPVPAKKAAAPRKRAASKPAEDTPLTEATPRKAAAPRKKAVTPKPEAEPVVEEIKAENPWNGVNRGFPAKEGTVVEEKSELPQELEPVKTLPAPVVDETPDLWKDVSQAQAGLTTHYSVKKENLVALGEGIKAMSEAHAKTIDALLNIIEGK